MNLRFHNEASNLDLLLNLNLKLLRRKALTNTQVSFKSYDIL